MARAVTAEELVLLRSDGQKSQYYAAAFHPTTLYTALINQTFESTDSVLEITYDTGSGTLANVKEDMTVFVGSTAGAYDIGICRLRSIDGTKLYIAETSDIPFANNQFLTIVNIYGLWARHLMITDSGTPLMDGTITYTNQHSSPAPVPIMGSVRILNLTGSTISTQYDFTESYVIDGTTVASYSTTCLGASSVTGPTTATPTVMFNAPGWYNVECTMTGTNGVSFRGVRQVYVYSAAEPPSDAVFTRLTQDVNTGGWTAALTMFDTASLDDIMDKALIVVFARDWYGDERGSIGYLDGSERVVFVGWISGETIVISRSESEVTFIAHTANFWLQKTPAYPHGIEIVNGTPDAWTEFASLTVDKGVWSLMHWRSTVTRIMDYFPTGDTRYTAEVYTLGATIWDQLREILDSQIKARAGCNRYSQLFTGVDPQLIPEADRDDEIVTVMSLTRIDWQEQLNFDRVVVPTVSILNTSGVAVSSTGDGLPFFSMAPGHAHPHHGMPMQIDQLLLSNQAQANQLCGLIWSDLNNEFPYIPVMLHANNRMIDCFPNQRCHITILAEDNVRGFGYEGYVLPTAVSLVLDMDTGITHTEVVFEAETFESMAIDGDVPGSEGEPEVPEFPDLPDFPPIDPGDIPPVPEEGFNKVLLYCARYGFLYTENFQDGTPLWEQANAGLGDIVITSGADAGTYHYQNFNRYFVTPSGAVWAVKLGGISSGSAWTDGSAYFSLVRAASIGDIFEVIIDMDSTEIGGTPPFAHFYGISNIGYDKVSPERVLFQLRHGPGAAVTHAYYYTGGVLTQGALNTLVASGGSASNGGISYGFSQWLITVNNQYGYLDTNGASVVDTVSDSRISFEVFNPESPGHVRVGNSARVYCKGDPSPDEFLMSNDSLASYLITSDSDTTMVGLHYDPSGRYLMAQYGSGKKGKSSDYGSSWSSMPSLPALPSWQFRNLGDSDKWLAAAGTSIRMTEDFGTTWEGKEGNLIADFPLSQIVRPVWAGP